MESGLLQVAAYGTCQCGCGVKTWVPKYGKTNDQGMRAGVPMRYLSGHARKPPRACPLTAAQRRALAVRRYNARTNYSARRYAANRDEINAKARRMARTPEGRAKRRADAMRRYYADADLARLRGRLGRHRRRGAPYTGIAEAEYVQVLLRDPCCYCGAPMREIDHIEPLRLVPDGSWENLTAACTPCNRSKRTDSLLAFLLRR